MSANANPRNLDLNLLVVFATVFECASITRAAERLALSQSATSHALSRLRDACNDDLFVRVGQGIVPTPVAKRIYPEIRRCLDGLHHAVGEARGFDPATSTRHFQLAIPHPMGPLWALALREVVSRTAPGVVLGFDTRTLPLETQDRMRAGELDACIDWLPSRHERFVNRKLFEDALVCIARGDHPRAGPTMTESAFRRERFVRVHNRPEGPSEAVEVLLRAITEIDLDWALWVSEYLEVPYVVLQTDLMGFVPRSQMQPRFNTAGLQVVPTPLPDVPIPIYLVWHETRRSDDGHRWLRRLVVDTIAALGSQ